MLRKSILMSSGVLAALAILAITNIHAFKRQLPVATEVFSSRLVPSSFWLGNLTLGGQGSVYGTRGKALHRIIDNGSATAILHTFDHNISAIHERADGLMIVVTDNDPKDPKKPCRIYRSYDEGMSFELLKTIEGGTILWWSIDSDRDGRLYIAEYGPQQKDMSKTLWRSHDDGSSWQAIYHAPDNTETHLHRIAVDPYTDDLWLTMGDGKNRAMLKSSDHGAHWQKIKRLQATAVAFGPNAIYWGKDQKDHPGILRYDRKSKRFKYYFKPDKYGNYGGSIYDMLRLPSGELVAPFLKYPNQEHVASVWIGRGKNWKPMLHLASEHGKGAGLETIAGPDNAGWVYLSGYQFKATIAE
jgi:hypothetical protein